MSKFCKNCGKELTEDTKFCMNCGTEVENEDSIIQKTQNQQQGNLLNEQTQNLKDETIKAAKNVVNKSQEFLQSEQMQNVKNSVVEKAKQTQEYL